MMKRRQKQSYSSLALALLFLAGAVAVAFVVSEHVNVLEKELVKSEASIVNGPVILDKEVYDELERYWVNKEQAPAFVSLLEESAQSVGVDLIILSLRYENVQQSQYLVAELSFGGGWDGVAGFMEALSALPHEKSVQNIQISQAFDESGGWRGSAILKVRAFDR